MGVAFFLLSLEAFLEKARVQVFFSSLGFPASLDIDLVLRLKSPYPLRISPSPFFLSDLRLFAFICGWPCGFAGELPLFAGPLPCRYRMLQAD